jgi:hypothetical protein
MIRCQYCGTDNLETARYCDECGAKIGLLPAGWVPSSSHVVSRVPEEEPPAPVKKTLASEREPEAGPASSPRIRQEWEQGPGRPRRAKLVITRGGAVGKEFAVVEPRCLIGRWDPDHGIFPEIDLDDEDEHANVSRRQAQITCENGQYLLEDCGSTNGTFINRGQRLIPGRRYLIKHGDEIIVGKLFLKFVVE